MRVKKIFLVMSLVAIFLMPVFPALAFEPPPQGGTIVGPELWAVVVLDCGSKMVATARVKRIVGCVVETQALLFTIDSCISSENDILYQTISAILFNINLDPNLLMPIITKVKNLNVNGNIVSFDAQIKFWQTE